MCKLMSSLKAVSDYTYAHAVPLQLAFSYKAFKAAPTVKKEEEVEEKETIAVKPGKRKRKLTKAIGIASLHVMPAAEMPAAAAEMPAAAAEMPAAEMPAAKKIKIEQTKDLNIVCCAFPLTQYRLEYASILNIACLEYICMFVCI